MTHHNPGKQNLQIFQNYNKNNEQFNRRGTQQLDEESLMGLRVGSHILNVDAKALANFNSASQTPFMKK